MTLPILDIYHLNKLWPTFERECFQPRIDEESVIPIFLDDTKFPGIPTDIVGIKFIWNKDDPQWQNKVTDEIVFKLIERLD